MSIVKSTATTNHRVRVMVADDEATLTTYREGVRGNLDVIDVNRGELIRALLTEEEKWAFSEFVEFWGGSESVVAQRLIDAFSPLVSGATPAEQAQSALENFDRLAPGEAAIDVARELAHALEAVLKEREQ